MRASRLLQILLLLQNRGRLTTAALAREVEVAQRTVLRDIDALTEAGLPVIVHRGQRGGVELGFNYRTRLTGLSADEAEALGVLLTRAVDDLGLLGLGDAARRAQRKLLESLPDPVRERAMVAAGRFPMTRGSRSSPDPRVPALATAIREQRIVRLRSRSTAPCTVHPVALEHRHSGWTLHDDRSGRQIPMRMWGDINISGGRFTPSREPGTSAGVPAGRRGQPR